MAIIGKTIGPTQLTGSAATCYTVPALTYSAVQNLLVTNTDSADHTVTVSIGTDSTATRILAGTKVKANGMLQITGLFPLQAGDIIQAFADTTTVLNFTIGTTERT
jgi:hypothetical protein